MKETQITNWTNYPVANVTMDEPSFVEDVKKYLGGVDSCISRGNGRCYGDASLGGNVLSTLKLDKILAFDPTTGILHGQSGILLSDILEFIVPKGWFLPVTPGTKFITLGGAIGSNVHGKNHHKEGSISKHILEIELLRADGETQILLPQEEDFQLTCGGMGLTGIVLSAKVQLKKIETSYINYCAIKAANLKEAMELFDQNKGYTYSMAWIDCLQRGKGMGRSILMLGEHAKAEEVKETKKLWVSNKTLFKMPFNFPSWVLNPLSIKAFNLLYYHKQVKKEQRKIVHYDGFYYPLDAILSWNKMYGKKGFIQYQPVFPLSSSYEGLKEVLEAITSSGFGSFLAVLKLMGKEDNEVSFPMEGYTLALDFPIKKGLFEFLDVLDEIVLKHGGRLYLSKDARMSSSMYANSYSASRAVQQELSRIDPKNKFSSHLNDRLQLK